MKTVRQVDKAEATEEEMGIDLSHHPHRDPGSPGFYGVFLAFTSLSRL
jgi:hypothetical protein